MHPLHAVLAGAQAVFHGRAHGRGHGGAGVAQIDFRFGDRKLRAEFAAAFNAVMRRNEHQLGRFQCFCHRQRYLVGVDAKGLAIAIEAERRNDGDDAGLNERLEISDIHPLHLAGEFVVLAAANAGGVGDDGIGDGGANIGFRQSVQPVMCQPVGSQDREVQRGRIGYAHAIQIGRGLTALSGEGLDAATGAVHDHDIDIEAAQDGDIHEQMPQGVGDHDGAIDIEHKQPVAKPGDVTENSSEVGGFHSVGQMIALRRSRARLEAG